ncbi:zinc-finger protein [Haematobia irritans]|uniref:zinc-finger protein n=1 Tax=Haematobia irritans TaxID=7368 RepID=UPI003F508046
MSIEVSSNCCRICLTQNRKLRSLYKAADEDDESPKEMLLKIAGITLEDMDKHEMLPKNICKNCEMSLSMAYEFREKALHSHGLIVSYMKEMQIPFPDEEEINTVSSAPEQSMCLKIEEKNQDLSDTEIDLTTAVDDNGENMNTCNSPSPVLDDSSIDMNLHDLIIPVKGEINLPSDTEEEYIDDHIEDLRADHTYEDLENKEEHDQQYGEILDSNDDNDHLQLANSTNHNNGNNDADGSDDDDDQYIDEDDMPKELDETKCQNTNEWSPSRKIDTVEMLEEDLEDPQTKANNIPHRNRNTTDASNIVGYMCDICGNVYSKRGRMMEHRQRHNKEPRYACELCGMKFHMRELLRKHMYSHSGGKPLKCEYCSRTFYYQSVLKAHEAVHKGVKPYVCDVCGKAFSYSHSLKKHNLIHEEVKLYRCVYCKKDFRLQHHMKQHELTKAHQKAVQSAKDNLKTDEGHSRDITNDVIVEED